MQNYSSKFKIFNFSLLTFNFEKGQALITLLFFVLISVTITSGAIIMIAVNSTSLSKLQEGTISYNAAEAGIENALLRVIRDPNYTGETLTIDSAIVVITVSGGNPKTIVAVGTNGNFKRTVEAKITYADGSYTFSGWKEI